MTLTKLGYRPRLIDDFIPKYLEAFGAVLIEGAKYCGKTWTSLHHSESVYYVSDPTGNYANRTRALIDPAGVLSGDEPRLIDEWQEAPGIWDAIRFTVDQENKKGRFLITGSSTAVKIETTHSGTGRIARLKMRPMTLFESGESSGAVSLSDLIAQHEIKPAPGTLDLDKLIRLTVRGGWPESLGLPESAAALLPEQYLLALAQSDISRLDGVKRDAAKTTALIASLARNAGQIVNLTTYEKDIEQYSSGERLSTQTISEYLAKLKELFIIEELPGWAPALRSPVRLRSTPKRFFVDPSLVVAGLRANSLSLTEDMKTLGFVFENIVVRDLLVYASSHGADLYHYLDNSQLDVDVIVSFGSERWAAIEIKLSSSQEDEAAKKLVRLERKLSDGGISSPLFLAVITGIGSTAHKRHDGVYVIPIDTLKP